MATAINFKPFDDFLNDLMKINDELGDSANRHSALADKLERNRLTLITPDVPVALNKCMFCGLPEYKAGECTRCYYGDDFVEPSEETNEE